MKTIRSSRRKHAAVKAAALLLMLLMRDYCAAQPTTASEAQENVAEGTATKDTVTEGKVASERDQLRTRIFNEAGEGAPQLALREARVSADAFSAHDLLQIEALVVETEVQWGRQQALATDEPDRLAQTRTALKHIDDMLGRIPAGDDYADVRRSVLVERVAALQGLGRM